MRGTLEAPAADLTERGRCQLLSAGSALLLLQLPVRVGCRGGQCCMSEGITLQAMLVSGLHTFERALCDAVRHWI
jgi:hypothetical protein